MAGNTLVLRFRQRVQTFVERRWDACGPSGRVMVFGWLSHQHLTSFPKPSLQHIVDKMSPCGHQSILLESRMAGLRTCMYALQDLKAEEQQLHYVKSQGLGLAKAWSHDQPVEVIAKIILSSSQEVRQRCCECSRNEKAKTRPGTRHTPTTTPRRGYHETSSRLILISLLRLTHRRGLFLLATRAPASCLTFEMLQTCTRCRNRRIKVRDFALLMKAMLNVGQV